MTEETQRANWLEDITYSTPALGGDILEACQWWRDHGYAVDNYSVSFDNKTRSTCRIYPRALYARATPHACDPDVIVRSGENATEVAIAALCLAARKWPGVV